MKSWLVQNYILIPGNLDIRDHLERHPPNIGSFKLEKLLDVIHLVYHQRIFTKWKRHNGFVQIKNNRLSGVAADYSLYRDYLISTGVLLCDFEFRPVKNYPKDPKSHGYRFSDEFSKSVSMFDKSSLTPVERRTRRKRKDLDRAGAYQKKLKQYPFIKYLDQLQMDVPGGTEYILSAQKAILSGNQLSSTEIEEQVFSLSRQLAVILEFAGAPSTKTTIDEFGNRLHSPLTRLNRRLRGFLTYKNQNLIAIDIRNSQPFFTLALLNPTFWVPIVRATVDGNTKKGKAILENHLLRKMVQDSNKLKGRLPGFLNIEQIHPDLAYRLWDYPSIKHKEECEQGETEQAKCEQGAMLRSSESKIECSKGTPAGRAKAGVDSILPLLYRQVVDTQEYLEFRQCASEGLLYERLLPALRQIFTANSDYIRFLAAEGIRWSEDKEIQREAAKSLMSRAMFARNRSQDPLTMISFDMLHGTFPAIAVLLKVVRSNDHRDLASILQRVESFMLLSVCIRAIHKKNNKIPIWTIHDSIVTIPKFVEIVKETIHETVTEYIGVAPAVKEENWKRPVGINMSEAYNNHFENYVPKDENFFDAA